MAWKRGNRLPLLVVDLSRRTKARVSLWEWLLQSQAAFHASVLNGHIVIAAVLQPPIFVQLLPIHSSSLPHPPPTGIPPTPPHTQPHLP